MTVPLIGPDGRKYTIDDPAKVPEALKLGYRVAAEPTALESVQSGLSDVGGALQAGAVGAVSGIAPGLVGAALAKSAEETPTEEKVRTGDVAELNRIRAEHPVASGAGELGGLLLSPVNKVVAPIEGVLGATSLAGRLGSKAVGNAAAGALFGAGNALSDASLENHDLTAEQLIAGSGLGAVLGGAGGLFGGALEEGVAALPKLGKATASATAGLEDFANDRWLKAGGGIQSDLKKIPLAEHGAVADVFRAHVPPSGSIADTFESLGKERDAVASKVLQQAGVNDAGGLTSSMGSEESTAALKKGFEAHGAQEGAILRNADTAGATFDHAQLGARVEKFGAELAQSNPAAFDLIEKDLEKVQGLVKRAAGFEHSDAGWVKTKPPSGFDTINKIKSTLQGDINYVADSGAKNSLRKQLVGIVRDEIDTQLAPQIGADLSKSFLDSKTAYGALKQASKAVKAKSTTGADAIAALVKHVGVDTPEAARLSALNHASRLVTNGLARKLGNNWLGPMASLTGATTAVMHGGPLGVVSGLASAVAHKFMAERGPSIIARLADHIAGSPVLTPIAKSFGQKLSAGAAAFGRYAEPLTQALTQSPAHALATHMTLAQVDPQYVAAAAQASFTPEAPEQEAFAMRKAHGLATIAAQVDIHNAQLDRHLDSILKGEKAPAAIRVHGSQDFGSKRMRRETGDAHQQHIDEVRQLAANPSALLDRITANVGATASLAPGVAASVAKTANAAVQYLAKQAEQPPPAGPLAPKWVPSDAEIHAYNQKLETVQEPMSVLRHAAAGTLTQDQVQALQAVYPGLARHIGERLLERVVASPKTIPYRAVLMVGMLTGTDPDGSMGAMARNQAIISGASRKPSNTGGAGTSTPSGNSPLTIAQRTALPSQRSEME